jgi:hypothetical protein
MNKKLQYTLLLALLTLGGCSAGNDRAVLDSYPGFNCPSPNTIKYAAWGENGLSKSCVNAKGASDGPFWAAEEGKFFFRGSYQNGQKNGVWQYVDKKGNVVQLKDMAK